MTWIDPPEVITQFRAQVVACPSAAAAGLVEAAIHYPTAPLGGSPSPAALPLAVIAESDGEISRYAESGVAGVESGTLILTIQGTGSVGALEALARAIGRELIAQPTGLCFRNAGRVAASDPTPGSRGPDDQTTPNLTTAIRAVTLTISYGLSA